MGNVGNKADVFTAQLPPRGGDFPLDGVAVYYQRRQRRLQVEDDPCLLFTGPGQHRWMQKVSDPPSNSPPHPPTPTPRAFF